MAQECKPVDPSDEKLQKWYNIAAPRWEAELGGTKPPAIWWGLYDDDDLIAAYGMDVLADGTVFVSSGLCEPSKRGLRGLFTLGIHLQFIPAQRRVRFLIARSNRRMYSFVKALYGAKPVAMLMEVNNSE